LRDSAVDLQCVDETSVSATRTKGKIRERFPNRDTFGIAMAELVKALIPVCDVVVQSFVIKPNATEDHSPILQNVLPCLQERTKLISSDRDCEM
jgi:hypothetical protein